MVSIVGRVRLKQAVTCRTHVVHLVQVDDVVRAGWCRWIRSQFSLLLFPLVLHHHPSSSLREAYRATCPVLLAARSLTIMIRI